MTAQHSHFRKRDQARVTSFSANLEDKQEHHSQRLRKFQVSLIVSNEYYHPIEPTRLVRAPSPTVHTIEMLGALGVKLGTPIF